MKSTLNKRQGPPQWNGHGPPRQPVSAPRRPPPGATLASSERQAKRPRLDPGHLSTRNKENEPRVSTEKSRSKIHARPSRPMTTATSAMATIETDADEAALMADLLSGIDASVFDAPFDSSPVKPTDAFCKLNQSNGHRGSLDGLDTRVKLEQRSPLKAKTSLMARDPLQAMSPFEASLIKHSPRATPQPNPDNITTGNITVDNDEKPRPLASVSVLIQPKRETENAVVAAPHAAGVEGLDFDDDDEYDLNWDLDALAAIDEKILTRPRVKYPVLHPPVPHVPPGYVPTPWARYSVDAVHAGIRAFRDCKDDSDPSSSALGFRTGKTLVVTGATDQRQRVVHLNGRWADLKARPGDILNIISPSIGVSDNNQDEPIVLSFSDMSSYAIHHPDVLVTMTAIANAMPCARRPLVQALVKLPEPPSKSMLYGTVLHSLLQGSLSEQSFDPGSTARRITRELGADERRMEVWGAGLDCDGVQVELSEKAGPGFETFGRKWVGEHPSAQGELKTAREDEAGWLAITGLHEVEEDIWSPKWGLKGKVDASVQARIQSPDSSSENPVNEYIAPLEIKTGRSVGGVAHRAQTMLYTLLMEDRYATPVPAGLLYYSQRDSIIRVEAKPNEVRALVFTRNELAEWMARPRVRQSTQSGAPTAPEGEVRDSTENLTDRDAQVGDVEEVFMPETIDMPNECNRCYAADSCMLYRKAVDRIDITDDDPIGELYARKTSHLTTAHADFFRQWEQLLTLEEQDTVRLRAQLWTMTAAARQKAGRCFADMVVVAYSNDLGKSLAKIHRHAYTFVRRGQAQVQDEAGAQDDAHLPSSRASLLSGHIARGDPVSLSIEPDLLCLARGFVTALSDKSVTVAVSNPIDVEALLARTRRGAMTPAAEVAFRIDKDEMSSGMTRMRGNLAQLFVADGDERRRRLVVDLARPEFALNRTGTGRGEGAEVVSGIALNNDQRTALDKVLSARDYALVLGMPGTGKTTTIAEIIKALVAKGKSVLLTSYTHSAVDTIVMKLLGVEFGVLRLGNIDKVHPDVQHLTLEAQGKAASTAQLESRLMSPPVVATTCLSIDHPLFFRRKFDYCIVDEASQITLPTCLGPIRLAETFVLVGDHFQLPPIVRNARARRGGLDVSLFRRLSDAHPHAVVSLEHQYRMNEDIMSLSNRLIYENRLKCGSEAVAKQSLVLPHRRTCLEVFPTATCSGGDDCCWLQALLDEDVKAVFVDTDSVPALDTRVGDLVQNETEAALVWQLSRALAESGVRQQDMAVITPYRQQIKLLSSTFAHSMPFVEILTADKSQGRDKDCVLISLVRSNETGHIGDLLRDWRRINVSFTRAKKKLVIFGSRKTLASDKLLGGFFDLVQEKGWIVHLPEGAHELHGAVGGVDVAGTVDAKVDDRAEGKGCERKSKVGDRLMRGLPFVKDVMAEMEG